MRPWSKTRLPSTAQEGKHATLGPDLGGAPRHGSSHTRKNLPQQTTPDPWSVMGSQGQIALLKQDSGPQTHLPPKGCKHPHKIASFRPTRRLGHILAQHPALSCVLGPRLTPPVSLGSCQVPSSDELVLGNRPPEGVTYTASGLWHSWQVPWEGRAHRQQFPLRPGGVRQQRRGSGGLGWGLDRSCEQQKGQWGASLSQGASHGSHSLPEDKNRFGVSERLHKGLRLQHHLRHQFLGSKE